jgi:5'-deoxynucleotidase YfbR-like HD superfamily hydrolase
MPEQITVRYDAIPGLTSEEKVFLDDIFARFPRVKEGYSTFTNIPPHHRIPKAAHVLQTQARTGWVLRFPGLPQIFRPVPVDGKNSLLHAFAGASRESVLEHCAEGAELYSHVYGAEWIPPSIDIQWGMECLKFHDFHEGIDGDFTPNCKITREEKKRLESISMRLLCEAKDRGNIHTFHVDTCHRLFEGTMTTEEFIDAKKYVAGTLKQHTRTSGYYNQAQMKAVSFFQDLYENTPDDMNLPLLHQRCADIDALHMGVRAWRMMSEQHISPEEEQKLNEFWEYITKKLKTPEAKAYFDGLLEMRDRKDLGYFFGLQYAELRKDLFQPN